jgi:hypothetical protein
MLRLIIYALNLSEYEKPQETQHDSIVRHNGKNFSDLQKITTVNN